MRRLRQGAASGLAALLCIAPVDAQVRWQPVDGVTSVPLTSAGIASRAELESFIDDLLTQRLFGTQPVAGAVIAIVKDRKAFFEKGYGCADFASSRAVDADTVFRVGSVSKAVTWTALMQEIESGRVGLEDPLERHVGFRLPGGPPMTIRNLFTHTTGLEENTLDYVLEFDSALSTPLAQTLERNVPARRTPPVTDFSRAEHAAYSNWGAGLAGFIAGGGAAGDFDAQVQRRIFDAVGMRHSTFAEPLPAGLAAHRASGYSWQGEAKSPRGAPCAMPTGGVFKAGAPQFLRSLAPIGALSTTANDMAAFIAAHLASDGRPLFTSRATLDLMHARALGASRVSQGAALGFWEMYRNGRRVLVHEGFTAEYMALLAFMPEEGVGLFIAVNSPPPVMLADLFKEILDQYFPGKTDAIPLRSGFAERAGAWVGTYRLALHSGSRVDKALTLVHGPKFEVDVGITPQSTLRVSNAIYPGVVSEWQEVPGVDRTYRELAPDGRPGQEFITFVQPEGNALSLLRPNPFAPAYRLQAWETASFQRVLMKSLAFVFAGITCVVLVALVHGNIAVGWAPALMVVACVCNIAGFAGAWNVLQSYLGLMIEYTVGFRIALWLLTIGATLAALHAPVCIARLRGAAAGRMERAVHLLFFLASLVWIASLDYWNLFATRLG
ncbi:MAG TPA: serine hydrolase domain-containing protein [Verrucomicrobiae bacterium]|nr:serine hydrolase domain-containing protein [Verrucomicrobiae bacterium]